MKTSNLFAVVALLGGMTALPGCVVDDSPSGNRGRSSGPVATPPDSGAPNRRGTGTEELNKGQPDRAAGGDTRVDPEPAKAPPEQ
jgi:hypothetical protein